MQTARSVFVLMFAVIATATGIVAQADDTPVLAVLEYRGGLLPKRADIRANPGVVKSPFAGMPRANWILREGDTLKQMNPPPERVIQFYQASGNDIQALCSFTVKYARGSNGWRPAFLLNSQPQMVWNGQKLVPRTPDKATQCTITVLKATPADAEGFYHSLAFGLASGPSQIDSWELQ